MSRTPKGEQKMAQLEEIAIPAIYSGPSTTDFRLEAYVNGVPASCLVDTGAAVSLMSESLWEKIKKPDERVTRAGIRHRLVGVQGVPLQLCGSTTVQLVVDSLTFRVQVLVVREITSDVILSRDFLQEHQCAITFGRNGNHLQFAAEKVTVNLGCHRKRSTTHKDATIVVSTTKKRGSDEMLNPRLNPRAETAQKGVLQESETAVLSDSGKQYQDDGMKFAPEANVNGQKLEAYSDLRHQLEVTNQRKKEAYEQKVHGKLYKNGDLCGSTARRLLSVIFHKGRIRDEFLQRGR